ncbi:hypothetical protein H310_00116 [Aphanomyces invadans]|uniref:Uncharacterized protein n=1 Tax=Aphanomyces invadans TaxID=157072 RepID=A0A024UUD3_9STRA|nr:hypothetical protein H310_00116 [Aphanomyces invadans]ETW09565.1 hypothetical protein H310_00116 [Aphanomyces invadans]|eukprot:XP_008860976.1 hypothetical protein H310_00116 [Aphanomyces invadans]
MLSRHARLVARTLRRPVTARRVASNAKTANEKGVEGKAADAIENKVAIEATENKVAAETTKGTPPADNATPRPGFFSRHPEIFFLAGLLGIGGYIYRSSVNNKKFNAVQNDLAEKTPISPFEAYELRSQNSITPEVFDAVKKQAKRYFPSNEATVAEFDLCLGTVLQGTAMKNTHHLERVLLSLPKNANGKVDVNLLLVAFSLAVKGSVDERLESLFALPLASKPTDDATLTKAQIEKVLGYVLDTFQVPSEKRVVALEDKAYPYQEYAVATPDQLLDAAVSVSIKAKTIDEGTQQFNMDQFALLMKSKAICIWGECYNSSSKKRMKN